MCYDNFTANIPTDSLVYLQWRCHKISQNSGNRSAFGEVAHTLLGDTAILCPSPCLTLYGINSLLLSVNLITVHLSLTCLLLLLPLFTLSTHHSYHPYLPRAFTPGSNLPLPQIFPTRLSSGLRTDFTEFMTGPFLLSILFFFVFF